MAGARQNLWTRSSGSEKIFKACFAIYIMKYIGLCAGLFLMVCLIGVVEAAPNATVEVEADIYAKPTIPDVISIEVPNHVYLGLVNESDCGNKIKVYMNNTGNVNISVTPVLINQSADNIFQNLYFQTRQSGNLSAVKRIGSYSFLMEKPSTEGGKESDYFYMWLDLTDYMTDIKSNMIGKKDNLLFVALPR